MAFFVGGPQDSKPVNVAELTEEPGIRPGKKLFSAKQTIDGKPETLFYELDANGNYFWIFEIRK